MTSPATTAVDSRKRPRSNSEEDNDDKLLASLVDGDDFVHETPPDEAERRRQARRQRLAAAARENDHQQLRHNFEQAKEQPRVKTETSPPPTTVDNSNSNNKPATADDDDFDMFSSSVSPVADNAATKTTEPSQRGTEQVDWDDAEGYYQAVIGETIPLDYAPGNDDEQASTRLRFRVAGVVGKGVFSSVLKCTTIDNPSTLPLPPTVALKLIRHNDTMARAAENELRTLLRLQGSPSIVNLLLPTTLKPAEYRGHVVMVFGYMEYNLRDVLQKFGKGVGLSLQAVRSYFGQLLAALTHLKKFGIIHADLKPDNILVRHDFGVVQLADFGSAVDVHAGEHNQPTPYLVSRFYRAPEIILGLPSTTAIDLWSLATTVGELFLGNVLFQGRSNNDMLYTFMQHLGPVSNRLVRQHLVAVDKLGIASHFTQDGAVYYFTQQTTDPVTGAAVHRIRSLLSTVDRSFPSATPLQNKLLKAKSAKDSRTMVTCFADLLLKCLALDPGRRIDLKEALRHEFFQTKEASK